MFAPSSLRPRGVFIALLFTLAGATLASAAPTVYLAGDSTMMTYTSSHNLYPQQGWGGRIAAYFDSAGVTFVNRAIGKRSSKSFVDEGRLASILNVIQPGDYLFIQFAHNDNSSDPKLHTDPFTTYKSYLRQYIDGATSRGAIPVLVTPVGRRNYDSSGKFRNDFTDRCTAMKQLATEKNCKLLDLNAKTIAFYDGLGVEPTKDVFLWLQPGQYPNFPNGVSDNTHFQEYGAGQVARLVTQGIEELDLAIQAAIKSSITYPAEAGALSGAGTVREKTNSGWRDQGVVNFPTTGGRLTLSGVIGRNGGSRTLAIRYSNGFGAARTGRLLVNGASSTITFPATASWSTWANLQVDVMLDSGTSNTMALESTGQDLANIDDITVSGDSPPIPPPLFTTYAENGALAGGTFVETTNTGYRNTGYVNFPTSGGSATFTQVYGAAGGAKVLTFRYANGSGAARTGTLLVNGVSSSITFPATASWTAWATLGVSVTLTTGNTNTIVLQSTGQDLANVDEFTMSEPPAVSLTAQAESATLAGGAFVETTNAGYRGAAYVNFPANGGSATFNNIDGNGGGARTLTIRYANGSGAARTGALVVNGASSSITFPATSSWTAWATLSMSVTLNNSAANTIALRSTGQDLANLDEITLQ
jgi:lysophospholipase L1-like esterase